MFVLFLFFKILLQQSLIQKQIECTIENYCKKNKYIGEKEKFKLRFDDFQVQGTDFGGVNAKMLIRGIPRKLCE